MLLVRAGFAFALLALITAAADAQTARTPEFRGAAFTMQGGEAVYRGVCQGCHMADARGAVGAGAYPALAGNGRLASTGYVVTMVMNGNKGMPAFRDQFTDQQIADVVNYVRSHFGNRFQGEVKPADVQALR